MFSAQGARLGRTRRIAALGATHPRICFAVDDYSFKLAPCKSLLQDSGMAKPASVSLDSKSWSAGYKAGHAGRPTRTPPPGVYGLSWYSGFIEGKADRAAGKVRPLMRKPPAQP
jgi:hypothetical protein